MNDFTTEILKTLANKGDLNELFRVHLEKAVNTLLKTELTAPMTVRSRPSMGNFISRFRATAMASSSNRLFLLIDGRMTR